MERKWSISKTRDTVMLLTGVLVALKIFSGQVCNTPFTPSEIGQENNSEDTDGQPQQKIIRSVDAIATPAQVHLTPEFYFITEILHSEENHEEITSSQLPEFSTFFTTLFRQIISPNAP